MVKAPGLHARVGLSGQTLPGPVAPKVREPRVCHPLQLSGISWSRTDPYGILSASGHSRWHHTFTSSPLLMRWGLETEGRWKKSLESSSMVSKHE
jgi:hypothetical protein